MGGTVWDHSTATTPRLRGAPPHAAPHPRRGPAAVACGVLAMVAALLVAAWAPTARADDDADQQLGMGLKAVASGKDAPAITLQPRKGVRSVVFELAAQGSKLKQRLKAGKIKAGGTKLLKISQAPGVVTWDAAIKIVWYDGSETAFNTTFKTTRIGKLAIEIGAQDVDMDAGTLQFRLTNPADRAELVILGENGRRLDVIVESFDGAAPGQALKMTWTKPEGDILRMDLKAWDIAGFWVGMAITPFTIEIPHDDVVFASGSAAVRPTEAPKLEATMELIKEALAKHGTLLKLKLFVAGYTDTVSDKASNRRLSEQRARSIAAWFRAHGLSVPIYFQGFGEEVLAVPTPDNTPEEKNRRALYILSSQVPAPSEALPRSDWKKL